MDTTNPLSDMRPRRVAGHQQCAATGDERHHQEEADAGQGSGPLLLVSGSASVGQHCLAAVDAIEVVDQRLDGQHARVGAVAGGDLPGQRLGDARRFGDGLPFGGGDRPETSDKGLEDGAHAPFFPVFGNSSNRLRESIALTLPTKRNNCMSLGGWRGPINDEELYEMASPPARDVLADNLKALMNANPQYGKLLSLEQATATRGGGKRIGKTTLANILAKTTPVNLDYVEILAKVFGLAPWQMLVPGLRPDNPQILRSTGPEEEALWGRLGELRDIVKQLDKLESGGGYSLADPIEEDRWPGTERRTKRSEK